MKTDKQIKAEFKKTASTEFQKYYPVKVLQEKGFSRHTCEKCSLVFWSIEERNVCGDANCGGGYEFIGNTNTKKNTILGTFR